VISPYAQALRFITLLALGLCGTVMAIAVSSTRPIRDFPVNEVVLDTDYERVDALEAPFIREVSVHADESPAGALGKQGLQDPNLLRYLTSAELAKNFATSLKEDRVLLLNTKQSGDVATLLMPVPKTEEAWLVRRLGPEQFSVRKVAIPLEHSIHVATGSLRTSLFAAIDAAGLPDNIATGLADIFAKRIDFQGTLRQGDRFKVVYESVEYAGLTLQAGKILAAELETGHKRFTALLYRSGGTEGYYTPDGASLQRGFLRSPLEYSRVTSGFTNAREHPLFHDIRHHTGTDFAAPEGSNVHATGPGTVAFIGTQTGYGNIIVLQHEKGISTVYGHLSGFALGLKAGARVQQSQVIGFVGHTGYATGPHLHYEYRINNVYQDAETVYLPAATPLSGRQLAGFRAQTSDALTRLTLEEPPRGTLND